MFLSILGSNDTNQSSEENGKQVINQNARISLPPGCSKSKVVVINNQIGIYNQKIVNRCVDGMRVLQEIEKNFTPSPISFIDVTKKETSLPIDITKKAIDSPTISKHKRIKDKEQLEKTAREAARFAFEIESTYSNFLNFMRAIYVEEGTKKYKHPDKIAKVIGTNKHQVKLMQQKYKVNQMKRII